MIRHPSQVCATCAAPVRDATLCADCVDRIARQLGDIGALVAEAERIHTTDGRAKGADDKPLIHTRRRRTVTRTDPRTGEQTEGPEPMPAGSFGRAPSTPWEADRSLGQDIDATIARQTAVKPREGGRSSSSAVPFNEHASKTARSVHNTLGTWVRDLYDDREPWPADDTAAFARWLLTRTDRIRKHPAAGEIDRDIDSAVTALRRAVDRPADKWFMGPCDTDGCLQEHPLAGADGRTRIVLRPTELYAEPTATEVVCRQCKAAYPIAARRAWLLAVAEDQLAHAELIGRAAPALGVDITPDAVRGYAHRGRIVAHGVDIQGRPLYRVGEVIEVARDVLARRAARERKTA